MKLEAITELCYERSLEEREKEIYILPVATLRP